MALSSHLLSIIGFLIKASIDIMIVIKVYLSKGGEKRKLYESH